MHIPVCNLRLLHVALLLFLFPLEILGCGYVFVPAENNYNNIFPLQPQCIVSPHKAYTFGHCHSPSTLGLTGFGYTQVPAQLLSCWLTFRVFSSFTTTLVSSTHAKDGLSEQDYDEEFLFLHDHSGYISDQDTCRVSFDLSLSMPPTGQMQTDRSRHRLR